MKTLHFLLVSLAIAALATAQGEKWDPDALVKFVKDKGARFIMPVATHHDNFDMYDSSHPWNSLMMGPKRDTLKEWKAAATMHGLKFGVSTHLYWSPQMPSTPSAPRRISASQPRTKSSTPSYRPSLQRTS